MAEPSEFPHPLPTVAPGQAAATAAFQVPWRRIITDALEHVKEVKGPGVIGATPVLRPGDVFEYTSGTPLPTPSGFMGGTYQMVSETGENFDIEIPTFSLDTPSIERRLN